jgi:hypothetical protein
MQEHCIDLALALGIQVPNKGFQSMKPSIREIAAFIRPTRLLNAV